MEINIETLSRLGFDCFRTGSREICNPPPLDTDEDYLVWSLSEVSGYLDVLLELGGWTYQDRPYGENLEFDSWRKGSVNILKTSDTNFALKFKLATKVAKGFNLLKKEDRISLFEAILYDRGSLYVPGRDWKKFLPKEDHQDDFFARPQPEFLVDRDPFLFERDNAILAADFRIFGLPPVDMGLELNADVDIAPQRHRWIGAER